MAMLPRSSYHVLLLLWLKLYTTAPFGVRHTTTAWPVLRAPALNERLDDGMDGVGCEIFCQRRDFVNRAGALLLTSAIFQSANNAIAEEYVTSSDSEMREFLDPQGQFSIRIPKRFFALRRSSKGDLPNEKTGQGRRGASIFTAGDMGKAEVVAVERFPTRSLLEENGIDAIGSMSTFPDLGEPAAIANLLFLRRERDKSGMMSGKILPDSLYLTSDGKELLFQTRSRIEVQKPELLMEQLGVSELYRLTLAKASLRSNDGNIFVVYASALESDFVGPDGNALRDSVESFTVADQLSTLKG